jgi:hypothetical protein
MLYYLIFSVAVLFYTIGQAGLLVSEYLILNTVFHRVQHIMILIAGLAYIEFADFAFLKFGAMPVTKRILRIAILLFIPLFIFGELFLSSPLVLYSGMLQMSEGVLYPLFLVMGSIIVGFVMFRMIVNLRGKAKCAQKLLDNEKRFIITNSIFFISVIVDILGIANILPKVLTHYAGITPGFVVLSLGISMQLAHEFSKSVKTLNKTKQDSIKIKESIEKEYEDILATIVDIIERDDKYTAGHSHRVMQYSYKIARAMGFSKHRIEKIKTAGILHDIGKVGVRKTVINKPGKLTPDEYAEVQKHPALGYDIVSTFLPFKEIAEYVRFHHEKLNGHGYPDGLTADSIPDLVKILTVADIYDALTSERPYREALESDYSIKIMHKMADDSDIDKQILKMLEKII